MSKFKVGDRAVFNCAYGGHRPGEEVVVTNVSSDYTYYQMVKDGVTGACFHHRLDKVADAPMLPLTGGQEPQTGEQILDRADKWLFDNDYGTNGWSITDLINVARFIQEHDNA